VRRSEEARDGARCFAHNALPMRWAARAPCDKSMTGAL
jgi:hypothetical protein